MLCDSISILNLFAFCFRSIIHLLINLLFISVVVNCNILFLYAFFDFNSLSFIGKGNLFIWNFLFDVIIFDLFGRTSCAIVTGSFT